MRRKISAGVDGGLSGGSSVRRPRSEVPHRLQRNLINLKKYEIKDEVTYPPSQDDAILTDSINVLTISSQ